MTNVRLALRMLVKTPVVTSVAVVSLALGIGSNAAIFSLYSQFLLRPLPVVEPERLVNLEAPGPKPGSDQLHRAMGGCDEVFSYPMFRDLQREQTVFTDIVAQLGFGASIAQRGAHPRHRPGHAGLRLVLPDAGPRAGARAAVRSGGRRARSAGIRSPF